MAHSFKLSLQRRQMIPCRTRKKYILLYISYGVVSVKAKFIALVTYFVIKLHYETPTWVLIFSEY